MFISLCIAYFFSQRSAAKGYRGLLLFFSCQENLFFQFSLSSLKNNQSWSTTKKSMVQWQFCFYFEKCKRIIFLFFVAFCLCILESLLEKQFTVVDSLPTPQLHEKCKCLMIDERSLIVLSLIVIFIESEKSNFFTFNFTCCKVFNKIFKRKSQYMKFHKELVQVIF